MSIFEQEERFLRQENLRDSQTNARLYAAITRLKPITTPVQIPRSLEPTPKPVARVNLTPWIQEKDQMCEDCGGSGKDLGELDPWDGAPCSHCAGSGVEKVTRNYLAEAFAIIGNPESTRVPEREHMVALVQYMRQNIDAMQAFFPEIKEVA